MRSGRRRVSGSAAAFFVTLAVGGCAAHHPSGALSKLLIHEGEPALAFPMPALPAGAAPPLSPQQLDALVDASPPPPRDRAATLEARHGDLGLALAAVGHDPTSGAHQRLGEAYRRLGVLDAAFSQFSQAVALDARNAAAYDARARLWRDSGFPEAGLGDAYRAVAAAPQSAIPHNTLGTLLLAINHWDHARQAFERAVLLDSSASYALSNLCVTLMHAGQHQQAIARCEAAVRLDPGLAAAVRNLALARATPSRP